MYTQGVMIMEQQIDGCLAGARNFSSVGGDGQVGQVGGHGQLGGGGQDMVRTQSLFLLKNTEN